MRYVLELPSMNSRLVRDPGRVGYASLGPEGDSLSSVLACLGFRPHRRTLQFAFEHRCGEGISQFSSAYYPLKTYFEPSPLRESVRCWSLRTDRAQRGEGPTCLQVFFVGKCTTFLSFMTLLSLHSQSNLERTCTDFRQVADVSDPSEN